METTMDIEAVPLTQGSAAGTQRVSRDHYKPVAAWAAPFNLADKVAGYTLREIRDLLQWLRQRSFGRYAVAKRLKISKREAYTVINALVDRGFLAVNPDNIDRFQTTLQGATLRNTRMWKRIARAKADKIVADLIARAEQMNASPDKEWLYYVNRIFVFGSYTGDSPMLGDIDIVLDMSPRECIRSRKAATILAITTAYAKRNGFNGKPADCLPFAWIDAERHLRNVSRRYVQLVPMSDAIVAKAADEGSIWCIYEREGSRPGRASLSARLAAPNPAL
jgi:hypothetical protein